ncbi:MAG TPA: peroxiredoxin [Microvirga sp.]|jgi:peroxiredoxin (alkyl hydroperoxide reductase subunit C)
MTNAAFDPNALPEDLPVPVDDGGMAHLAGAMLPDVSLPGTDGEAVSLARLPGRVVVYGYPRTGQPGLAPAAGWDLIPGARGCTPQSCGFRDHFAELKELGVARVLGLSTQDTAYQREAAERLHLPFPILSDEHLAFAKAAGLPTFEVEGQVLLKRFALVVDDGRVVQIFYPVFPPDRNAQDVADWLRAHPR